MRSGSTHFGGSPSMVEILVVLTFHVLRIDSKRPEWAERDRFILSPGRGAPTFTAPILARALASRAGRLTPLRA